MPLSDVPVEKINRTRQAFLAMVVLALLISSGTAIYALLRFDQVTDRISKNGRAAFAQIEESRAQATTEACKQRNAERRLDREDISRQIRETRKISAEAIEALNLNITKDEALKRLREDRASIPRINCEQAAREVRRTSPDFPPP